MSERASFSEYKRIFSHKNPKISYKNKDFVYLYCNESLLKDLKRSLNKVVGKTDKDLLGIREAKKVNLLDKKVLETNKGLEYHEILSDGVFSIIKQPFEINNEKGILTITSDISNIVEKYFLLEQKEKLFRNIFEESNDAVFLHTFDGRILNVNNKACKMLGFEKSEFIRTPISLLHPKSEKEKAEKAFNQTINKGSVRFEAQFLKKDQSLIDVEISSRIIDKENKTILGIVRDISLRKEVENKLQESESMYRCLVECAHEGIGVVDKNEKILFANPAFAQIVGYEKTELIGKNLKDLTNEDEFNYYVNQTEQRKKGKAVCYETSLYHKNKETRKVRVSVAPIISCNGEYKGALGMINDITKQKKIEDQLFRSSKMSAIGHFVAGINHELNNPLSIIKTNVDYINASLKKNKINKKDLLESIQAINQSVDRASQMVGHLKDFSRNKNVDYTNIDVKELMEKTINLIVPHLKYNDIKLNKKYTSSPVIINACPDKLEQVFVNILMNAKDAINEKMNVKGEINIEIIQKGNDIKIDIKDNGVGVPMKNIDDLFNPFFTTKEVGKGTGLGLSLSYDIVNDHKGSLTVSSKENIGACFTINLPAVCKNIGE